MGTLPVLIVGGVGHVRRIETLALVRNDDPNQVGRHAADHANLFSRVQVIAMLDRVDQCLFQRQMDAEDVMLGPVVLLELTQHLVAELSPGPGQAGDQMVAAPNPSRWGHVLCSEHAAARAETVTNAMTSSHLALVAR
jgi:hypothetical protein